MKYKKIGKAVIHYDRSVVKKVVFLNKKGTQAAEITREFAMAGGKMLGIDCRVNGMGPENRPKLRKILQKLPCADDFEMASCFHDVIYALAAAITNRLTADKIWKFINKIECIKKVPWYKKFYFTRWNWYGYWSLRASGESSWGTAS